jgi:hypothetical protein
VFDQLNYESQLLVSNYRRVESDDLVVLVWVLISHVQVKLDRDFPCYQLILDFLVLGHIVPELETV